MKVTRKVTFKTNDVCIGDQITIKLRGFGKFTATAQRIAANGNILFLFDNAIAISSMNKSDSNVGGFEFSELNWWLHNVVVPAFPDKLRHNIGDITLPTYGEIFGHDHDKDFYANFEPDNDEQFELMKRIGNRVCDFNGIWCWWWLRNATKKEVSSAYFAYVDNYGDANCNCALYSFGVRPKFWLVR